MRGTGVTTRKIDQYIQDIFTQRFCDLSSEGWAERFEIVGWVKRRLRSEHDVDLDKQLTVSDDGSLIELSKSYRMRSDA